MKKVSIKGKEIELVPNALKITSEDSLLVYSAYDLSKHSWNGWCNLIAWLMNCDDLHFFNKSKNLTAKDIFESNSHGELMFVHSASSYMSNILSQISSLPGFKEQIDKCLVGEEVKPDPKFATGFGLKCRTILWKTDAEFEAKVDEILKENWG